MEAAVASSNVASEPPAATEPAAAAVPQPSAQKSPFKKGHSGKSPARRQRNPKGSNQNEPPVDLNSNRKVMVSGYPHYTQPQDLARIFSTFGTVKVDNSFNKFSTLLFSTTEEAAAALQSSDKVNIYGEFLSVKPFDGKQVEEAMNSKQRHGKQAFPRSKDTATIIAPQELDLTGDFDQQVSNILDSIRLTQEQVAGLGALYVDVEQILQNLWPGCKAMPFGSITTGLGVKSSDADCYIALPPTSREPAPRGPASRGPASRGPAPRDPAQGPVTRAKRLLQRRPDIFAEILAIPHAYTPIVKFFHVPTAMCCDLTFKTPLGVENSRLLAALLRCDRRFLSAAVLLKYWARVHELSGAGRLSNYALALMLIFYLQQPPAPCLPSVLSLQAGAARAVDGWQVGIAEARAAALRQPPPLEELLGGFFEFYAMFDFDEMVVCPYLGTAVRKDIFKSPADLGPEFAQYRANVSACAAPPFRYGTPLAVLDPYEHSHNVASAVPAKLAADLRAHFKFAADAYGHARASGCRDFLPAILLQKPKLFRPKSSPEYRVNLFPRVVATIAAADWRAVVRQLVFTIFEKLLKVRLGKVEEKVSPDTRKQKEKYTGSVQKPIWERRQLADLCRRSELPFEELEARITESLLNSPSPPLELQVQLLLTYCHEPRSAVVSVRHAAGDAQAFKDFGKLFISVMQSWFAQLLPPHAQPAEIRQSRPIDELESRRTNEVERSDEDEIPTSGSEVSVEVQAPATQS